MDYSTLTRSMGVVFLAVGVFIIFMPVKASAIWKRLNFFSPARDYWFHDPARVAKSRALRSAYRGFGLLCVLAGLYLNHLAAGNSGFRSGPVEAVERIFIFFASLVLLGGSLRFLIDPGWWDAWTRPGQVLPESQRKRARIMGRVLGFLGILIVFYVYWTSK